MSDQGNREQPDRPQPSQPAQPPQSPPQAPPAAYPQPSQVPPQGPPPQGPPPQGQAFPPPPPPGAPYPGGPGPGQPFPQPPAQFTSPRGLSVALTVLFGLCVPVWLLAIASDGRVMNLLDDLENNPFTVSEDDWDAAQAFYGGMGAVQVLLTLATGVVFLVWFYRVRVNAELFDPAGQRMKRGWAIGAWFVPVVNLWFPKKIANDAWRASAPWGAATGRGVLTAWWTCVVVMEVARTLALPLTDYEIDPNESGEIEAAKSEVAMHALADLAGLVGAILAIVVVRRLTTWQLARYQQGPVGQPQPPTPYAPPAPHTPAPHTPPAAHTPAAPPTPPPAAPHTPPPAAPPQQPGQGPAPGPQQGG